MNLQSRCLRLSRTSPRRTASSDDRERAAIAFATIPVILVRTFVFRSGIPLPRPFFLLARAVFAVTGARISYLRNVYFLGVSSVDHVSSERCRGRRSTDGGARRGGGLRLIDLLEKGQFGAALHASVGQSLTHFLGFEEVTSVLPFIPLEKDGYLVRIVQRLENLKTPLSVVSPNGIVVVKVRLPLLEVLHSAFAQ